MEDTANQSIRSIQPREPWNKGKLVGQKAPLNLKEVWAIRVWLQLEHRTRELALFDLGLDSELRSCDLVKLRVRDVCHGDRVAPRATVMQQKTSRPVQFEITEATRSAVADWMKLQNLHSEDYLFPNRIHKFPHIAQSNTSWLSDIAVAMAMASRENRLSYMPGVPWVTPSHMAGTPPATWAVAPSLRASSLMMSG